MSKEEEKQQMDLYGITTEQKTVFHYMGYTYDRLTDALNYARIDSGNRKAAGEPEARTREFPDTSGKESDHISKEEEKQQMDLYGITTEQKTVFHYMGYTYDRLTDALHYASVDSGRRKAAGELKS